MSSGAVGGGVCAQVRHHRMATSTCRRANKSNVYKSKLAASNLRMLYPFPCALCSSVLVIFHLVHFLVAGVLRF